LMYFISDKCLIATKLRKYFEKTKDKVLTIRNIRRHFGCYGFSDNLPYSRNFFIYLQQLIDKVQEKANDKVRTSKQMMNCK
ncbi:hypothetical protein, partial [Segatella sp.]|uniref:hypothetical protein n=2 Tax=Segatella sp. TaxID=2974253 RepID=UPI003AAAF74E